MASGQFKSAKYFGEDADFDRCRTLEFFCGVRANIVTGDFDGDGKLDVAVTYATPSGQGVKVYRGDGRGGFTFYQTISLLGSLPLLGDLTFTGSLIAADFHHNGILDLAVLTVDSQQNVLVAVLPGSANGFFGSPRYYVAGKALSSQVYLVAMVGDFWGDGRLDIAVADVPQFCPFAGPCTLTGNLVILKGDGDGSFEPARSVFKSPSSFYFLSAVADVNHDGKDDLVIENSQGQFEVLLATGEGHFASSFTSPLGVGVVAVGDFYGDGNLELVGENGAGLNIWAGDGKGHFHTGAAAAVCAGCRGIVGVADFNNDGKADLWIANGLSATVKVLIGKGDGTFWPSTTYSSDYDEGPSGAAIGDFNGDGKKDIAILDYASNHVGALLLGNGDGTFYAAESFSSATTFSQPAVGDFNEDGNLDLALTVVDGVQIFQGDGKGRLKLEQDIRTTQTADTGTVAVGDFNLDGHQDLAVVNNDPDNTITILLGDGRGTFTKGQTYSVGAVPTSIAIGDFNQDGILDLVVTNDGRDDTASVLLGLGDGRFIHGTDFFVGINPQFVTTGEIIHGGGNDTHGGGNDLVVANCGRQAEPGTCSPGQPSSGGSLSVLLNKGDGGFVKAPSTGVPSVRNAVVADFNLDGNDDLVIVTNGFSPEFSPGELLLLLGKGDGSFKPPISLYSRSGRGGVVRFVATGDFNGDGKPDLVAIDEFREVILLLGNGDGTFQPPISFPAGTCSGFGSLPVSKPAVTGDFNGDGASDFVCIGDTVAMFLNSGGTLMDVHASASVVAARQKIQLDAAVAPSLKGALVTSGTVTFRDISTFPVRTLGVEEVEAGQAHIVTSIDDPGVHIFEARYSGDKTFNPNTAVTSVRAQAIGAGQDPGTSNDPGSGSACSNSQQVPSLTKSTTVKSKRVISRERSTTVDKISDRAAGERAAYGDLETKKKPDLHERSRVKGQMDAVDATNIAAVDKSIGGAPAGFRGFEGLDAQDSRNAGDGNQSTTEPPDEGMAVGNGQVMQVINDAVAIYSIDAGQISGAKTLNAFFNLPPSVIHEIDHAIYGPFVSDPSVLFDADTQRWFVTAVKIDTDSVDRTFLNKAAVMIAVSETPDAAGRYNIYSIDITDAGFGQCPCASDQPLLGANRDGIYISANQYSLAKGTFQSALILALGKERLVAGQATVSVGFQDLTQDGVPGFSIYPARSPDTSAKYPGVEYFMSTLDFAGVSGEQPLAERGDHRITIWALGNTASLRTDDPDLSLQQVTINSEPYAIPRPVTQKPGPTPLLDSLNAQGNQESLEKIDANDDRMQQVFFADDKLYGAVNTRIGPPNDTSRVGVGWFVVDPEIAECTLSAKISQQGYVAVAGANVMFPAVAVNKHGDGAIGFSIMGPTMFPSFGYIGLNARGVQTQVHIAARGAAPEDGFSGYVSKGGDGVARWGDYSAAAVGSDGSIWLAGEYISGRPRAPLSLANWGTFIGTIPVDRIPVAHPPDLDLVMTGSPDLVHEGDIVTYTMTFHNTGSLPAIQGSIVDYLPEGFTFVSSSILPCGSGVGVVRCDLGPTIPGGFTLSFQIQARVPSNLLRPGEISRNVTNNASIMSHSLDPDAGDGPASVTTTIVH